MPVLYPKYSKETAKRLLLDGKLSEEYYIDNYMTEKEAWEFQQAKRKWIKEFQEQKKKEEKQEQINTQKFLHYAAEEIPKQLSEVIEDITSKNRSQKTIHKIEI